MYFYIGMEIKDIQGNILIDALVTEQAVKVDELMKQHSITLSWESVTDEQLPLSAYIEHEGVRYSLLAPYNPEQSDEATYAYKPVFEHPIMRWQHIPFFFYTYSEGKVVSKELDWSLTDNPANFMKAVCDAILNETGEDWSYEISADLPASASQSFSNTDIFSALNAIAGAFETEWWFDYANKIVYLSKAAYGDAVTLEVGHNIGIPSKNQSKEGYYTRFYAFGSTRNIEQSYAGSNVNSVVNRRLTLNPEKYPNGYIDIREGLTESEVLVKTLVFDDIYPRSSLTISDVKVRLMWRLDDSGEKVQIGTDSEGNPVYDQYAIWYFKIPGLSFSKDMLIEGKALSVHFNSGSLNGREFELTYHDTAKEVTTSDGTSIQVEVGDYEINFIEEGTYIIPAITGLVPMEGDAVTLFNIVMPEEYKVSAYEELEQEVRKEIAKQGEDKNNYTFDSNKVAFFESNPNLSVGRNVLYKNGSTTLATRVIKLETQLDYAFEQKITIGNAQIKGTQQTLKEEVVNANQSIDLLAAINENTEAFQQSLQRTQKAVLDSLAKWGDMWTYDAKNKAVRSKYNIISDLDVISGGDPDTEGEESKASVVVFTPILTNGIEIAKIQIDGVVQSIYAPESYEVDLSGYATKSYVNTAIQNAKDTRVDELINTTIPGLSGKINSLRTDFDVLNTLLNDDVSGKINTWNEVVDFLDEYSGSQDLTTILSGMNADIAKRALQTSLDTTNTNLTSVSNRVKTLEDMFEWDGDTIKAKASFYSIGEISSFGLGTEGDGTGGVTALAALDDVNISNPTDGQSLVYDLASGKWVNKTVSGGISKVTIKLGTASYDSVNGVVALPAYPTTLKNPYALTWSGHSNGSYDGSSAVNIAIPTSLPASDVYSWAKKSSLAANDVPNLDWSKITSGKPTTLSGYGITDAYTASTIDSKLSGYLPLSGGIMSGMIYAAGVEFSDVNYPSVQFRMTNDNNVGWLWYNGGDRWGVTNHGWTAQYNLIHSGNIGSYNAGSANNLMINYTTSDKQYELLFTNPQTESVANIDAVYRDNNTKFAYNPYHNILYVERVQSKGIANNWSDTWSDGPWHGLAINGSNSLYDVVLTGYYGATLKSARGNISLTSGGNVLIGTTEDRGYKLQVEGSFASYSYTEAVETLGVRPSGASLFGPYAYGLMTWVRGTGNAHMQVGRTDGNATAYNLIMQHLGGNVLIGTTTDNGEKLQVNGNTTLTGQLGISFARNALTPTEQAIVINSAAYASTYAAWPGIGFHIPGITYGTIKYGSDDVFHFMNATLSGWTNIKVGNLVATGEVSSGSDARYKAIQSYVDIDIETIANAPIINFKWNDREDDKVHLGSTAQYWYNTSLCNGVTPTDDEKLWTMGYGQIALASVVSVAKKVVNHEEEIKRLKKKVNELENELNQYRYGLQ